MDTLGIIGYSAYVPRWRVARKLLGDAWGAPAPAGTKAVGNFDEDALTMAQAAAWPLVASGFRPDALYFASTTAPFWQRSPASLLAAHCDLPPVLATADFGGSQRCGTAALRAALDSVSCGRSVLVAVADTRDGKPESAEEMLFGDGAAAVALGARNVVAEIEGWASRAGDFLDEWRRDIDPHVHSFTSKFSATRGYVESVTAAARELLEAAGVPPGAISRVVLASPDGRVHQEAARALGISPERVEDPRVGEWGVTGCAMPLLLMARALDQASPGDLILMAGYGEGADALLWRVTDEIRRRPRPLVSPEALTLEYPSYPVWAKLRHGLRDAATADEMSNVFWQREESQNVRLHGTFCPQCGRLQFPITRVCGVCRGRDGLTEKPLPRTGSVFTFTKDYLYEALRQPTVMTVVELEGGTRFLCQMTDCDPERVEIGMKVELVLRRLREGASLHHYYWKCRPL